MAKQTRQTEQQEGEREPLTMGQIRRQVARQHLWAVVDRYTGEVLEAKTSRQDARNHVRMGAGALPIAPAHADDPDTPEEQAAPAMVLRVDVVVPGEGA